jgi:ABC-2 type transport system ATP-binding protein
MGAWGRQGDEPTIGLDVVSKARLLQFLQDMNREMGITLVLTTRDIADVERLCERMVTIDHGRVIYDGRIAALRDTVGEGRVLVVDLERPEQPLQIDGAITERVYGARQRLKFKRRDISAAVLIARVTERAAIVDLTVEEPPIEEIVRRIYLEGLPKRSSPTAQE